MLGYACKFRSSYYLALIYPSLQSHPESGSPIAEIRRPPRYARPALSTLPHARFKPLSLRTYSSLRRSRAPGAAWRSSTPGWRERRRRRRVRAASRVRGRMDPSDALRVLRGWVHVWSMYRRRRGASLRRTVVRELRIRMRMWSTESLAWARSWLGC